VILDQADGTLLARAQATFVGASDEKKRELKERYGFHEVSETPQEPEVTGRPVATGTPDSVDAAR